MRSLVAGLAALMLVSSTVAAQDPSRLGRLDERTRGAVLVLADSARRVGLPVEPLIVRALEGASKRADGPRIVANVRMLARELGAARSVLGSAASEAELVAGASALRARASLQSLAQLRDTRPRESLTVPLAVLADLVARGVPADTAAQAVIALAARNARDEQFIALRRDVELDVEAGAPASVSAMLRARGGVPAGGVPALSGAGGLVRSETRGSPGVVQGSAPSFPSNSANPGVQRNSPPPAPRRP